MTPMESQRVNPRPDQDLCLRKVRKSQGSFVLGPLDLRYSTGITALLGANGAGKTTLMRIAVGILDPDSGEVGIGGYPVAHQGGLVGYLPQDFAAPKNVRVGDYLRFIAWCRSRRGRTLGEIDVRDALVNVELDAKRTSRIGTLSGGMVRRLGIAQALIGATGVIVLDEPTVGLDPVQRRELRALLERLGTDTTVLVSTHLSEDVAAVANHVTVLHEGAIVHDDSVESLIDLGGSAERSGDAVERGFLAAIGRRE